MVTPEKLDKYIYDFLKSILVLRQKNFIAPSIILTYSLIDTLAWLNLPPEKDEVDSTEFRIWVDKYLHPKVSFQCTSLELYAARCGMVHSNNADTSLSSKGAARKIYYSYAMGTAEKGNKFIREERTSENDFMIDYDELLSHLIQSIDIFLSEKDHDPVVLKRAENFLIKMPESWIP